MMLAWSASMKFHVAIFGEPGGSPKRIPAGTPAGAKPWMCAAISPDGTTTVSTMLTSNVLASVSITNVPVAIAGDPFGGVSAAPLMVAANCTIAPCAGAEAHRHTANRAAATPYLAQATPIRRAELSDSLLAMVLPLFCLTATLLRR